MTPTFQTSLFTYQLQELDNRLSARRRIKASQEKWHMYQVEIENFDSEFETFEIEAMSAVEAAEEAEHLYQGDIYNMCIYDVTGL